MAENFQALQAYSAVAAGRKLPEVPRTATARQAYETAQDFEATFLSQMLRPMFENTQAEKPFGGGMAEEMWQSMQIEEYGKAIAKAGGIGLTDAVYKEIMKMQEVK